MLSFLLFSILRESEDLTLVNLRPFHFSFLTREFRACARASYRYDVGNGIRSLDWSIPVNFFRF